MDDPKNPNQNPLDPVVPTTPITDVPPAPEPLSPEDSTPPIVSDPQQDVPPPPSVLPADQGEPASPSLGGPSDLPPPVESGLPPVVAPPPAKSKTKLFAAIAAVVLLLVSIPAGIILVRQQTDIREQAAGTKWVCTLPGGDTMDFGKQSECTTFCIPIQGTCGEVSTIPPQCPDGQRWEGPPTTGSCVPNSTTPTCPSGEHWEGPPTTGACVPNPSGTVCTPGEYQRTCTGQRQTCDANAGVATIKQCKADGSGWEDKDPECRTECAVGGGPPPPPPPPPGEKKIGSGEDGPGGCCDQGVANNSANGCRVGGGFNEVCDISNGACQSGLSCRSLAGCAKDTDCGPGNKCVNNKCEAGGGPPPPPPPPASPPPEAGTCNATIAGLPGDFISPNQSIPVTVKLDSSTAGCEYVALRTDGTHEPSLKTVSGACVGATYGATINSGLAGQHKLEFAVNDTQPYPGAPSRSKTVCSTKTFETIDVITAPTAYCSNLTVSRGGAPITDFSQVVIGDNLTLQATCLTTNSGLSFDKIRFRVTTPTGAQPDQDQTATKDLQARIEQSAEQPNVYKATSIMKVDRVGSYNIKAWGHTKEDNKWKGKK